MTDVDATGNGGWGATNGRLEELKWGEDEVDAGRNKLDTIGVLKAGDGEVKRALEIWPGEGILVEKGKIGGGKARNSEGWGLEEEEGTTFPSVTGASSVAAARSSTRVDSIA